MELYAVFFCYNDQADEPIPGESDEINLGFMVVGAQEIVNKTYTFKCTACKHPFTYREEGQGFVFNYDKRMTGGVSNEEVALVIERTAQMDAYNALPYMTTELFAIVNSDEKIGPSPCPQCGGTGRAA